MPDGATASPLTFDIEVTGDVALVRLHGKLTMGVSNLLHVRVKKLIPEHKRIVLDLSDFPIWIARALALWSGCLSLPDRPGVRWNCSI